MRFVLLACPPSLGFILANFKMSSKCGKRVVTFRLCGFFLLLKAVSSWSQGREGTGKQRVKLQLSSWNASGHLSIGLGRATWSHFLPLSCGRFGAVLVLTFYFAFFIHLCRKVYHARLSTSCFLLPLSRSGEFGFCKDAWLLWFLSHSDAKEKLERLCTFIASLSYSREWGFRK